jgi:hypothetical protein
MLLRSVVLSSFLAFTVSAAHEWFPKQRFSERRKQRVAKALATVAEPKAQAPAQPPAPSRNWKHKLQDSKKQSELTEKDATASFSVSGQQTITDHGNTFLTISLEIGSQQIKAIPDSGSFELYIVDGADCELDLCKPAYKPDESRQHFTPDVALKKDIYFGSGTCGVELSFDFIQVHNEAKTGLDSSLGLVPLWRIVEMDENLAGVWGDGHGFQGIVGLGFKGNVNKEPSEVLIEEKVVFEAKRKTGQSPTKPGFASKALFGDAFAICLPRGEDAKSVEVFLETDKRPSQTDGRLWWGSAVPHLNYFDVPVVGTRHWTVRVDSAFFQYHTKSDKVHHMCGGPSAAPCAALIDSGTSLIAMSEQKIKDIVATSVIGDLNPDCSNVDEMPDLIFALGNGKQLKLSPDTYIMKIAVSDTLVGFEKTGRVVLEKGKVLNIRPPPKNMVRLKSSKPSRKVTYCTHAFMETPMETALVGGTEHDLIILGIPVFREYTIKFDRAHETVGFAEHPFGVTCHGSDLMKPLSFVENARHPLEIRTLDKWADLVFPDEFALI